MIALADAEAVAAGRFAPDLARVDAQRAADRASTTRRRSSEVFEDQVACADIVLLTKPDLAGAEGVARARAVIAAEAPRPLPVVEVTEGAVDPARDPRPRRGGRGRPRRAAVAPRRRGRARPRRLRQRRRRDARARRPADIAARIERLARERDILRVKGYAAVAGKPMRLLVQAVGARVRTQYDRPWRPGEARRGQLVVIAERGDIDAAAIRAALAG